MTRGHTLLELVIALGIILVLATIAVQSWLRLLAWVAAL